MPTDSHEANVAFGFPPHIPTIHGSYASLGGVKIQVCAVFHILALLQSFGWVVHGLVWNDRLIEDFVVFIKFLRMGWLVCSLSSQHNSGHAYRCEDICHSSFDGIREPKRYDHLDTVAFRDEKYLFVLSVVKGNGAATSIIIVERIAQPGAFGDTGKSHNNQEPKSRKQLIKFMIIYVDLFAGSWKNARPTALIVTEQWNQKNPYTKVHLPWKLFVAFYSSIQNNSFQSNDFFLAPPFFF